MAMSPSLALDNSALRVWVRRAVLLLLLGAALLLLPCTALAQVVTVDSSGRIVNGNSPSSSAPVDRRYGQIDPTHVALGNSPLDGKTRLALERFLEAEQGFAMRPLPRGHKGLMLAANGKVEPAGEGWLQMVTENGISAKPGERVTVTNVKIDHNKMIFDLNGGPDLKHRFMRHVEIGGGTVMTPMVQDNGEQATGARITLAFDKEVPEMTGTQVEDLLSPLISFRVKTPVEAYTDTLPPVLKNAILNHHVLVGMNTDMVIYAMGRPETKTRETEGQMPIEIWIYGQAPKSVEFVRFNGDRVIRLEIADVGKPIEVFTKDEVSGLMRTDGSPVVASNTRTVEMGDASYDPNTQAAPAPPTLRKPGEKLPDASAQSGGDMRPVQFPKQTQTDSTNAPQAPAPSTSGQTGPGQTGSTNSNSAGSGSTGPSSTGQSQTKPAQTQPVQQPPAQPSTQSSPQTN
jgi:hypothetical protein